MEEYTHKGPVDCNQPINVENLKGKTAIVTGGANGLGEAYVRALVAAGVKVCIGDPDVQKGSELEQELPDIKFIRCDITKWTDQVELFRQAVLFSSTGLISHVIANAGIHRRDEVFSYSGDDQEPEEPDLSVIDVNIRGTLYTAKLAAHYFIRQSGTHASQKQEDSSLVLIGSGAAFLDCPRSPQYSASKWAMRGIMHSYVKTNILSDDVFKHVCNVGVELAKAEDAGQCLLRILSDPKINGHSLFVSGRKWASSGYLDLDLDDYPQNALIQEIQEDQMRSAPVSLGLFG
ncbi:Short-chain dehydrogenase/reductase SDR [Penicillium coprophilum]|uniref:Short-chain dehydrogenase/reductase SDR n=1 Tax=Penicillium coprophilum TaxID=36646 RepID=UPI00238FF4BC|nr:Short-chain dehydrogenase/reductase SDR [Penicillium coprophilum]KAJ5164859.1 Short-chain dehydrogenase/reductase SDR [Penicillium coprophilum]